MTRIIATLSVLLACAAPATAQSHGGHGAHAHESFSAGVPGDPKKKSRVVQVTMREGEGKMLYEPARLEIKRGEQVRFVLTNAGELEHEFVLASTADNLKHAEQMKKNPDMEHDDPNARRVAPKQTGEIVWRFTKRGTFEYGCLIPGHREAGMTGIIVVK